MNKIQQQAAQLDLWVGGFAIFYIERNSEKDIMFSGESPRKPCESSELRAMRATKSIILNMMGK